MFFIFKNLFVFIFFFIIFSYSGFAFSLNIPDCEFLANVEEEKKDLPDGILSSISRVEAGRIGLDGNKKGWPWTINHSGEGLFFESKGDAIKYVNENLSRGDLNLDVGCMQISIKWHSVHFNSLEEMFDPEINIAYASQFLRNLYATHGDWEIAIKHYHSANPQKNIKYLKKVLAVWSQNKNSQKSNDVKLYKANIILPISRPKKHIDKVKFVEFQSYKLNSSQFTEKIVLNIRSQLTKPKFLNERWNLVEKFKKEFAVK